jgi:hypothetical protein
LLYHMPIIKIDKAIYDKLGGVDKLRRQDVHYDQTEEQRLETLRRLAK